MNTSIFKAYDIRGIYPTDINVETVGTISKALAKMFGDGEFIIAHDARHGSKELIAALEIALASEMKKSGKNITITNVGLSSSPMFYFTVCDRNAVGGAMITASHNPKEYNGMKIVKEKGAMVAGTEVLDVINTLS